MVASTPAQQRVIQTFCDLPQERQEELAETVARYAEQFTLPVIR